MNDEYDEECTCDVGPFATCPACERVRAYESSRFTRERKPEKEKPKGHHLTDLVLHYDKLRKEER